MTQNGVVDLDALVTERKVRLNGEERVVRDIDGVGYQLLLKMRELGPEAGVTTMYAIAARCLGISKDEADKLSAAQVGKVVELAAASAEAVEATVPKARTAGKKAIP